MTWRMRFTGGFILDHTWYEINQFICLNQLEAANLVYISRNPSPSLALFSVAKRNPFKN